MSDNIQNEVQEETLTPICEASAADDPPANEAAEKTAEEAIAEPMADPVTDSATEAVEELMTEIVAAPMAELAEEPVAEIFEVAQKAEGEAEPVTETVAKTVTVAQESGAVIAAQTKKENSSAWKTTVDFLREKVFTEKTVNIIFLFLCCAMTAVCAAQVCIWLSTVSDVFYSIQDAVEEQNYMSICMTALTFLFVLVLLVQIIKAIASLVKKPHTIGFEQITTVFAFFVFFLFAEKALGTEDIAVLDWSFFPLLSILLGLAGAYALVRLVQKDFDERVWGFVFAGVAMFVAVIMFMKGVGNVATIELASDSFAVSEFSLHGYLEAVVSFVEGKLALPTDEALFLELGMDVRGFNSETYIWVILLQFIPIVVANLLPFAALSLVGYLIICLMEKDYVQFYSLHHCRKAVVAMLTSSLISLVATILLSIIYGVDSAVSVVVEVDYIGLAWTILSCIIMIVLTSIPWKMYKIAYNRQYQECKKDAGDV